MVAPVAILALMFTSPVMHDGTLKGAEAYQQLRDFESQYVKDAKAGGKSVNRREQTAAYHKKADELLTGFDISAVPAGEGLDWSHVLETATRYKDSITVLDKFLTTNPSPDDAVRAKVAETNDFRLSGDWAKGTSILHELKPGGEATSILLVSADYSQAMQIGHYNGEDAGLKFLDEVAPNFKEYPKATERLDSMRKSMLMPKTRAKLIGEPAPAISILADKYGSFTDLASLKGKVVLLDFFAHWCGPCIASMPDTRAMSDTLGDKLAVVGVTAYYGYFGAKRGIGKPEEFADMKGFMDEHKIDHPVVYVDHSEFADYGCNGIPEFVLIGKDGLVKHIQVGYDKKSFAEFRKLVEAEAAK